MMHWQAEKKSERWGQARGKEHLPVRASTEKGDMPVGDTGVQVWAIMAPEGRRERPGGRSGRG